MPQDWQCHCPSPCPGLCPPSPHRAGTQSPARPCQAPALGSVLNRFYKKPKTLNNEFPGWKELLNYLFLFNLTKSICGYLQQIRARHTLQTPRKKEVILAHSNCLCKTNLRCQWFTTGCIFVNLILAMLHFLYELLYLQLWGSKYYPSPIPTPASHSPTSQAFCTTWKLVSKFHVCSYRLNNIKQHYTWKICSQVANRFPILFFTVSSCCYILFIWKIISNSHENSGFLSVKMIVRAWAADI